MAKKQELEIARAKRREAILDDYETGYRREDIADRVKSHVSTVDRVLAQARDDRDPRVMLSEREMEMKRAELWQEAVVKEWREGVAIEEIAKRFRLQPREVRAAVYLAVKDGKAGGVFAEKSA